MIDDKKIENAARQYLVAFRDANSDGYSSRIIDIERGCFNHFKDGANWAINEFLKDLCHSASEVPRNDNGKILAFSKVNSNIKLYDMNAMLNETACDTYQEMWEIRVRAYTFTDWVFVEDLLDLIKKGGKQ